MSHLAPGSPVAAVEHDEGRLVFGDGGLEPCHQVARGDALSDRCLLRRSHNFERAQLWR